jgi:Rieske Fe-S protein
MTPGRRTFLWWATVLLGTAAAVLLVVPFVIYVLAALWHKREPEWVDLGPVDRFPVNETRLTEFLNEIRQPWDGMVAKTNVYVRRLAPQDGKENFLVFAVNCTHLGCPVTWFPQSGLFMCPCHGGVYYENGEHASGPPPRGLYHAVWKVEDGKLWVQAPHLPTLDDTLREDEPKVGCAGQKTERVALGLRNRGPQSSTGEATS